MSVGKEQASALVYERITHMICRNEERMEKYYQIQTNAKCRKENMVTGNHYRISVLTPGLLRLEYAEQDLFEDRPTQIVWNRDLGECVYQVVEKEGCLEIITERLHLYYDKKPFSTNGLRVVVQGGMFPYGNVWYYGNDNRLFKRAELKGTARTLDNANGEIPLEDGLVSLSGYAVLDDSRSLAIREDGWVEKRRAPEEDIYFWGYGSDYLACIQDFYRLSGPAPMIPRYVFGNWWSRYHKYTEESYRELMGRFEDEKLPFSVAVIDMDWHLVNIDKKYGNGWTGYTWNREFFPDPERFLKWLHDKGMHVTLNVHPADGVRAHEEMYEEMGKALGVDTEKELPIPFDVSDKKFMEAYFNCLHHPREKEGVDFWWIDWQQGGISKVEGMDPLWMLNHYHFLDNGREGKRPMTFSRYAGPGSHRYPIGFSGDTIVSWESLAFQPYFTASASNIGYGMWSHDIGGHMLGKRDDELSGRWVQFGVFSPIMRLHSSDSRFISKEPWRFREEIRKVMEEFLRLRHKMIPYLYTMNYRQYAEKTPMILPMYYAYPGAREAYQVPNQYLFGSQMVAAAVTTPCIKGLNMAKIPVWLPEGEWYDIFTGLCYHGGRKMNFYRDITSIPVLAKAGAIIPFQEDYMENANENPRQLHLFVYTGDDGSFMLYEDDNITMSYQNGECVKTNYRWEEKEGKLYICAAEGELSLIPENRDYVISFCGIRDAQATVLEGIGGLKKAVGEKQNMEVILRNVPVKQSVTLCLENRVYMDNDVEERCFRILNHAEIETMVKESAFAAVEKEKNYLHLLSGLLALNLDPDLYGALAEVITA